MKHRRSAVPMISYYGSNNIIIDQQVIDQLIIQLKNSNAENFRDFLKLFPPIKHLIRAIPSTLPLLDIILTKSLKYHKSNSSKAALHYNELFNHLLWWIACNEQKNIPQNDISKVTDGGSKQSDTANGDQFPALYEGWERHARSILVAVQSDSPHVLEAARCAELRFADGLEALGCHGLVNCSDGLIGLTDAVRLEVASHYKKIKGISARLRNLKSDKHRFGVPSDASHYRQVNSRLSQIYVRISENKRIKDFLVKSLTNVHLSSLLRIVRRRLICDQTLIKLFKVLADSAPPDYMLSEADPIAANVIATFKIAYHKLLGLVNQEHSLSINGDYVDRISREDECRFLLSASDTNTETDVSVTDFSSDLLTNMPSFAKKSDRNSSLHDIPQLTAEETHQQWDDRAEANALLEAAVSMKYTSRPCYTISRHQSLNNLSDNPHFNSNRKNDRPLRPARSMSSLEHIGFRTESRRCGRLLPNHYSQIEEDAEVRRLKLKVKRLYSELRETQQRIRCLVGQEGKRSVVGSSQDKELLIATDNNSRQATSEEVSTLINKFANLYDQGRAEILKALEELPEFRGSEELQQKTIMSIIVLTYRSVQESVERRRQLIFEILGDQLLDDRDSQSLDTALYRYMSRKAKYEHGIANAKEVTSQIWNALYDFPALRTCTIFNKFILECVAVAWELVAGIDGKAPRMCIEYESIQFDAYKHQRYIASSNFQSSTIQRYLWPAVIDRITGACLHKAVVIT